MESLPFFVGVVGNVISVLMFLSPVGTFWRIIKQRSTEDFESLPYVCTLLSASLWTYYGIIKPGAYLVATVNGFGILVEIVYVALFLIYAPAKMRARTAILVGLLDVGFLVATVLVTKLALQGEVRIDAIGFICSGLNIIMYASPLAAMVGHLTWLLYLLNFVDNFLRSIPCASTKTVVMTKSVEYMPFFLSFFFFLNGGIWTFYAVLTSDYFLGVPNGTGFLLGMAQLVLYAMYRKTKPSRNISNRLEEGRQQESLISPSGRSDEVRE